MTDNLKASGTTNADPNTCVDAQCSCNIIWSLAQQFSMGQLLTHTPTHNGMPDYREGGPRGSSDQVEAKMPKFISDPEVRARRIAAAYARVYLEDFHLGDKTKIGRFYWLALGAFASKQVAATLKLREVRYLARWSELRDGLGQGNLWLFNDVLAWFYGYAAGRDTFEKCAPERDSRNFVSQVATNFTRQREYAESIAKVPYEIDGDTGEIKSKLGYLRCTPIILKGFRFVDLWEDARESRRPSLAMSHLLAIAQHEQGEVLQGLIYDNPSFTKWLNIQREALSTSDDTAMKSSMDSMQSNPMDDGSHIGVLAIIRAFVPNLQLVLTSEDDTDSMEFKSVAPDGLPLQDYKLRMQWIKAAAHKFDLLMQGQNKDKMIGFLQNIKKWGDLSE